MIFFQNFTLTKCKTNILVGTNCFLESGEGEQSCGEREQKILWFFSSIPEAKQNEVETVCEAKLVLTA